MHSIRREDWQAHRNYPDHLLLLGSHENFRRISGLLVQRASEVGPTAWGASLYHRWKSAMRGHEAYEEHKLYPYLARRWGVSFADAEAGHEALRLCDRDVQAALQHEPTSSLVDALRAHHDVLLAHLRYEEDLVIPLLLELSREEFHQTFG